MDNKDDESKKSKPAIDANTLYKRSVELGKVSDMVVLLTTNPASNPYSTVATLYGVLAAALRIARVLQIPKDELHSFLDIYQKTIQTLAERSGIPEEEIPWLGQLYPGEVSNDLSKEEQDKLQKAIDLIAEQKDAGVVGAQTPSTEWDLN